MLFQEEITRYQLKIRDFAPPNWGFEDKEIPPGFVPGISPESVVTFMGKMIEPWDFEVVGDSTGTSHRVSLEIWVEGRCRPRRLGPKPPF